MRTKNPKQKRKVEEQEQRSQVGNKNRTEKGEHRAQSWRGEDVTTDHTDKETMENNGSIYI